MLFLNLIVAGTCLSAAHAPIHWRSVTPYRGQIALHGISLQGADCAACNTLQGADCAACNTLQGQIALHETTYGERLLFMKHLTGADCAACNTIQEADCAAVTPYNGQILLPVILYRGRIALPVTPYRGQIALSVTPYRGRIRQLYQLLNMHYARL